MATKNAEEKQDTQKAYETYMEKTPREEWMTYDEFAFEYQVNGNKQANYS